jgi:hypothetical protein
MISETSPERDPDSVFRRARAVVTAEIQAIYFEEYLPALLGDNAIPAYSGYDAHANPAVSNFFSIAAFRFGHSQCNEDLLLLRGEDMLPENAEKLALKDVYFKPELLGTDDSSYDALLRGMISSKAQDIDTKFVDGVRNFLFGEGQIQGGVGGVDLASLNIQRGRNHQGSCFTSNF